MNSFETGARYVKNLVQYDAEHTWLLCSILGCSSGHVDKAIAFAKLDVVALVVTLVYCGTDSGYHRLGSAVAADLSIAAVFGKASSVL